MKTVMIALMASSAGVALASDEICGAPRLQARAEILWTKPLCKESGRYIGWPTLGKAPNGDLLAVFSGDRDAHICPWGKVQMVRSADGGKTWSAPETICDSSIDDRDAGILLLDDGTLLLSWFTSVAYRSAIRDRAKLDPASRQWQWLLHDETISPELEKEQLGAFTRRSTDGGRTWEPPVRTPCSSPHGPIQLRDGRLLYVGKSGDADHADLGPGVGKIVAAESTDRGRSWRLIGEVPFPEGINVLRMCHEPHAVETDDGRIVAQIRYECPWMPDGPHESIQTESADGGRTWSEPRPVGLDGFPPHLLRLADGALLSVFGRRTGELGEYACLSDDQGRTWDVANEIRLAGHWSADIGYPSSVQLPDGTILTAYYQSEREGEPPCVMGTLWRVRPPADASTPDPGFSISEGKDWVRLDFHKDVEPGSALDFSGQGFQDAPAGKHGWLRAVGGHFEFEGLPGVEQRFYGVNLCDTANFPDHELADRLADRLARAGYNAVRIHHHDRAWAAAYALRANDDGVVSDDAIDRLDYFLARCFKRGIYATTDLYVSRPVTWREIGIDRDGEIEENMIYKHYVGIHDGAFSNWCGFAKAFLEHVNPYTGRSYKDEPGMPLISLVNEGALYIAWKGARKAEDPVIRAAWEECRKELSSGRDGAPALPEEPPARGPEDPSDPHYRFEHWLGRRTWERCSAFLRALGCRALLTNENNGRWHGEGEGNTPLFDYVDTHFYVDHPEFLERPWRLPSRCPNENPIRAGRPEIFGWGWAKGASKPYVISEWNLSSPGRYRAMGGILTGALAAEQEWDGLWRFAYSHYAGNLPDDGELKGNRYFDCALDPLIAASDRASVCLFLGAEKSQTEAWSMNDGTTDAANAVGVSLQMTKDDNSVIAGVAGPSMRGIASHIIVDRERGALVIDTPFLCGGFTESGRIDAGPLSFEICAAEEISHRATESQRGGFTQGAQNNSENQKKLCVSVPLCEKAVPSTLWVSSLDGAPIPSSSRILLVHLTDVQGDGARFADDTRQVLLDWGGAPLVEVGATEVELRLAPCGEAAGEARGEDSPRPLSVFALDTAGRRVGEIPSRVENGVLRFRVCTAGEKGGRIYYEITR